MKTINIRYLCPGLISADAPDNWDTMTLEERTAWASEQMEYTFDAGIINGLAELENVGVTIDKDEQFFDENPDVLAIEEVENVTLEDGEEIQRYTKVVTTDAWEEFFTAHNVRETNEII